MKNQRRIGIIGAGVTGLVAAWRLSQKGHLVLIFEKEKFLGGLAAGFKKENWYWPVEHFYHHFFVSDFAAKKIIKELNLSSKLFFQPAKISIFKKGRLAQFDSPFSLLTFPYLSFGEKCRTAVVTAYLKLAKNWKKLEKTTAADWLSRFYGARVYRLLWEPLLNGKFGRQKDQVAMAWFWARIKKRDKQLGYLEGGLATFIRQLEKEIRKNKGEFFLNREIKNLEKLKRKFKLDQIIMTGPMATFLKIASGLPADYRHKLQKLKMIGTLNLVLELKEKLLKNNTYWLNINESNFPFLAVIEHTNFVASQYFANHHLVYVGGYYPQNHRFFKMSKNQIFKEFLPYLQKINPQFNTRQLIDYSLFTHLSTQPVMLVNYSKLVPALKTPLPGIYLANMQMIHPWDRGINYAIELGEKIADEVSKK